MSDSKASQVSCWRAVSISASHLRAAGTESEREIILKAGRRASRTGQPTPPLLRVESGGFEVGGKVAAVFLAGVGSAAFGGELAAGVLPTLAGVVPMKANLRET